MYKIPALKPSTDYELQILKFQKIVYWVSLGVKQLSKILQHLSQNYSLNAEIISELNYL